MFEASVYKPTVMRPLPPGAEVYEEGGQQFARWRDQEGRARTAPVAVPEKGPYAGQQRLVIASERYVARYRDSAGAIRTVATNCTDEAKARHVLERLVREARVTGGSTQVAGGTSFKSFRDHFRDYLQVLKACELPAARVADVERQVRRIARQCHFLRLTEVNGQAVRQWLSQRQAEGMPTAVCNTHLDDLLNFVEWCLREGRLAQNPLQGLGHLKEAKATGAAARPLTEEEVGRLVRIGLWRPLAEYGRIPEEAGTAVRFVPVTVETLAELVMRGRRQLKDDPAQIARLQRQGWQRALIYKALALTGLRRSELVSLKIRSLSRGSAKPYLRMGSSDAGKGTKIPLRADLAADLKLWVKYRWRAARRRAKDQERAAVKQAFVDKPLFKLPGGLIKALTLDLAAAGIGEKDESGVRVDIYAARGVREEILSRPGVSLAVLRAEMDESESGTGKGRSLAGSLLKKIGRRQRKDRPAE